MSLKDDFRTMAQKAGNAFKTDRSLASGKPTGPTVPDFPENETALSRAQRAGRPNVTMSAERPAAPVNTGASQVNTLGSVRQASGPMMVGEKPSLLNRLKSTPKLGGTLSTVAAASDVMNTAQNPTLLNTLKTGASTASAAGYGLGNPVAAVGGGAARLGLGIGEALAERFVNPATETNPLTPTAQQFASTLKYDDKGMPIAPTAPFEPKGLSAQRMTGTIGTNPVAMPAVAQTATPAPELTNREKFMQRLEHGLDRWGNVHTARILSSMYDNEMTDATARAGQQATLDAAKAKAAPTALQLAQEARAQEAADSAKMKEYLSTANNQFFTPEGKPDLALNARYQNYMRENTPLFATSDGKSVRFEDLPSLPVAERERISADMRASFLLTENANKSDASQWFGELGNTTKALKLGNAVRNSDGTVSYDTSTPAGQPHPARFSEAGEGGVGFLPYYGWLPGVDNRVIPTSHGLMPVADLVGDSQSEGAADRERMITGLSNAKRNTGR